MFQDAVAGKGEVKTEALPIVVDLDGTLTTTDTLVESLVKLVKTSPLSLLRIPFWLSRGRARFKEAVAERVSLSAAHLPYHEGFVSYLRSQKDEGRSIILATAAHAKIAQNVSDHFGIFDAVLATESGVNLKGSAKLKSIQEKLGTDFVYAGDSAADMPIWKSAKAAILVGVRPGVASAVRQLGPVAHEFPKARAGIKTWLRAMRIHQWLKNVLLFVPLLTAFSFLDLAKFSTAIVAFFAFSMAASATYIVNDLWDLESDRAHPRKRERPLASGRIPIVKAVGVAAGMLLLGLGLAFAISKLFFAMLLFYLAITSAYSWTLKSYVLIDVIVLSLLYTLRILAGSAAVGIVVSSWLLAFAVFIFLSLALVKRCSELIGLGHAGQTATRGRDYRVSDLAVLWPLGVGAALSSVVIFGLFISAPETQLRYATPELLWLAAVGLIYWLARIWIKTSRAEMHDDPLIYAIRDKGCLITTILMVLSVILAHFVSLEAWL